MSTNQSLRKTLLPILLLAALSTSQAQTPLGSAFTYQGQLKNGGSPANGNFNMVFKLFDSAAGVGLVGPTLTFDGAAGNLPTVSVANGLFIVALDFGAEAYNGDRRWLEITVNSTTLTPRQELTSTPHAQFSTKPWATSGADILNTNTGKVGVGTPSPATKLDVRDEGSPGTQRTIATLRTAEGIDGTGGNLDWAQSGVVTGRIANVFEAPGRIGLSLHTYDAETEPRLHERVRIANNGNVGIGTTSPLDLAGYRGLTINHPIDGAFIELQKAGAQKVRLLGDDSQGVLETRSIIPLKFGINGQEKMRLESNGNVGIGTTTPEYTLDVNGTARLGTAEPAYPLLLGGQSAGIDLRGSAQSELRWSNASGNGTWVLSRRNDVGGDNDDLKLLRYTPAFQGIALQVSNASGNVGIGTTNPGQKLTVAGTIESTFGGIKFPDGTTQTTAVTAANKTLVVMGPTSSISSLSNSFQSLASAAIPVPGPGSILVTANGVANIQSYGAGVYGIASSANGPVIGTETAFGFAASVTSVSGFDCQCFAYYSPGSTTATLSCQYLHQVGGPGTYTFHLVAHRNGNTGGLSTEGKSITLLYIPS